MIAETIKYKPTPAAIHAVPIKAIAPAKASITGIEPDNSVVAILIIPNIPAIANNPLRIVPNLSEPNIINDGVIIRIATARINNEAAMAFIFPAPESILFNNNIVAAKPPIIPIKPNRPLPTAPHDNAPIIINGIVNI